MLTFTSEIVTGHTIIGGIKEGAVEKRDNYTVMFTKYHPSGEAMGVAA